ncbi:MAG: IS110 family transposase [Lachnospiraceae bacterium]|nr:IS110 family transposase [Lachnospiraceae bacterium]
MSIDGADIAPFSSSKRLCYWAGLSPDNNDSTGEKKSFRIICADVYR